MRKKLFTFLLALVTSVGLSWATDPIVIVTNTSQSSYTQGDITITCSKPGDSEGFYLDKDDNETATITNSGSSTISQIELGIGWFPDDRSYVRVNGAEPTSSDPYSITFSNVNSNNVTLTITNNKIQIRDVTITLADEGGSTPSGLQVTELQVPGSWQDNPTMLSTSDMPGFVAITEAEATAWDAAPAGNVVLIFAFEEGNGATSLSFKDGVYQAAQAHNITYEDLYGWSVLGRQIFYTGGGSTPTPTPNPNGECGAQGDNLLWEFNPSTGTLTITGSGAMADWHDDTQRPWYSYYGQITSVVLPEGLTTIGEKAFKACDIVSINTNNVLPSTLTTIKQEGFCGINVTNITIPASVVLIEQDAFYLSGTITDVYCYADPNNLTWGDYWCDDFISSPKKTTQCHVKSCYLDVFNSKWNTGNSSTDINVTYVGDLPGDCGAPTPTPTPSGDGDKLPGAFSVSGTKVVYFSKGNLQATTSDQGATWTWGFAENQWDYVGNAAANTSFDYYGGTGNGSYDLFGWIGESSALDDYRQYGIGSNYDFTDCGNTAGEDLKADWGSLMGSDWRTLTYDEWQYLIASRDDAADLRAYATVNGKTGLILLPDSWTSSSVALTITTANYTTNIISASDWSTLEEQGCVFLPAAGWRSDDSVGGVGEGGDYWSSSSPSGKQYDEGSAYCFFFDTDFSKQADGMHFNKRGRGYGLSVRLVSETAPSGGSTPAVDPAVQNVIDLINAIPNPVVYNQECYNALEAVYNAYVALSEEQREQVTNYNDYLEAQERYYMLASVNYVIEKINEIGDVEFTSACKHRIDYARSEYCNLTLEQKGYVTNYNTLLAAEAAYAALIPVSSTVVWDEAILETIDVDEWDVTTFTNGSLSLKAVDGHAYYVDGEQHFLFDGSNSEKSFVFSCTSANMLCIEITVSEKHEHNELSCAWQETATGYRWVGEATSVDLASTISKVTGIRFSLGEAFPEPTPTPAQDGDKLPGAFSVSGGKVVYFSKGNLQYLGNIDRWHFAENQWTIIGNSQASDNRDLFSWGTGDNPDSEDYSTYTEWGNNIEGNWRTLTVEEWTYLFNTRTDASSKYGTATVAGVVGLILLPDVYDGTAINTDRTAWDNNVISSSDWAAYEAAGSVFLPAAGLSDAFGVYGVGEQGFYWSSTMDALSHDAISVFYGFDNWEGYWFNQVDAQFQPQEGHSVRLVSETAPTPVGPSYIDADFAIDFRTDPYTVVGGDALPTGVEVEGSMNTSDAAHGYRLPVITIPVKAGNYKVMMGTCTFSNQDATIKTEDGSHTYATLATNNGTCYHQNTATNVVGAIFNVPSDQIIKVYGAEYTPFFSIKKMAAVPAFTDFEINFQTDPYNVISGAKPEGTVIAGSFHDGQHGYQNVEATVPMEAGTYRLTLGACGYGNGAGNVLSETNVELAAFNQKLAEESMCYVASTGANTVSVTFTVDIDQTITIDCGQYTPYMKLEKISAYHVVFALGDAEGSAPAAADVTIGEALTMPVNKTMYKAGYTLTGWSDGVNTYAIGEAFTPASDAVLTPVFTANAENALQGTTARWYFGTDNGAPEMHLEGGSGNGFLIAQATDGNKTVDVKLSIDATSGKFKNTGVGDARWAQVNANTVLTFPSAEDAIVKVWAMNEPTESTLDDNTKSAWESNIATYDAAPTAGTSTYTVLGNATWYGYIEVTYPAPAAVVIGDPNNASEVETFLETYDGQTIDELIIDRPVLNNMYNTLCLPFDMNAAQIAASSLNGVIIREFTGASVVGQTLELAVSDPVNAVVAGRPYFVQYSAASQLDDLHFEGVTINNAVLDDEAITFNGVTFKGTFTPFIMPNGLNFQGGYLFLGQNNQLFWPNTSNPLKPFRAYFYVDVEASTPGNAPKYRGMPARIVEGKNVVTGVENAQSANQSTKVIVNGQLIIIKNDVRYNAQGQIVK